MLKPVIQTSLDRFWLLLFDPCKIQKCSVFVPVPRCQNKSALLLRRFRMNVKRLVFLAVSQVEIPSDLKMFFWMLFCFPFASLSVFYAKLKLISLSVSVSLDIQKLWVSVTNCVFLC